MTTDKKTTKRPDRKKKWKENKKNKATQASSTSPNGASLSGRVRVEQQRYPSISAAQSIYMPNL